VIVNFSTDMRYRFATTAGDAVLESLKSGKSLCVGIEYDGVGEGLDVLEIKAGLYDGVNIVLRDTDNKYRWTLRGADGNEYAVEMALEGGPPLIEIPAIRARYFGQVNGGIFEFGRRQELGRLSERR
jgi:hypothetical protein